MPSRDLPGLEQFFYTHYAPAQIARSGKVFTASFFISGLAAAGTAVRHVVTPANVRIVGLYRGTTHNSDGNVRIEFGEDAVVNVQGSTEASGFSFNRRLAPSHDLTIYTDTTFTSIGTVIDDTRVLGSGSVGERRISSGLAPLDIIERELKKGTDYALRFTNNGTAACDIFTRIVWYEE